MIPLELDHLAHVLVLDDGAIASCFPHVSTRYVRETERVYTIFLLESLKESFGIVVLGQALNSRQRLATVALWRGC
jgi:hypothetical protein